VLAAADRGPAGHAAAPRPPAAAAPGSAGGPPRARGSRFVVHGA